MIGWLVLLAALALVWRYAPRVIGTSLPPGYTLETFGGSGVGYERLRLRFGGEVIMTSGYLDVWGYRTQGWKLGRAAWTHHAMTSRAAASNDGS